MKKKLLCVLLAAVLLLPLPACGETVSSAEHPEDYVFTLRYHDYFNILQLTDIHWNVNTSVRASEIYLDKLLAEVGAHIAATQGPGAKIDLVELTGDMFMLANSYHLDTFIDFFERKAEEYGFLYAPIWGNHDRQGLYHPKMLAERFQAAAHCLYRESADELYGRSNYVINLTEDGTKDTPAVWMIANLDSGADFSETEFSLVRNDDFIRPEQTDWFLRQHALAGEDVPAVAYYHIPQDENGKAWRAVTEAGAAAVFYFLALRHNLEGPANVGIGVLPVAVSASVNLATLLVVLAPLIVSVAALVKGLNKTGGKTNENHDL